MSDPDQSPSDRGDEPVAVVTGGARGIGWAVVERLVRDGWRVVASDVRPRPRADPPEQWRAPDERLAWCPADVTVEADVEHLFASAVERFGRLDGLVNNAALTGVHRDWTSVSQADWDRVVAVNLGGAFRCCRLAAALLRDSGRGRIVNIGSVTFSTGQRHLVDYVSAKGGIVGLTRTLARELGPYGVTVNTVSPGAIRTEAELEMFPDQEAVARDAFQVQAIPRRGEAADVAAAVVFLMSKSAGFITGQELHVDGGWILS